MTSEAASLLVDIIKNIAIVFTILGALYKFGRPRLASDLLPSYREVFLSQKEHTDWKETHRDAHDMANREHREEIRSLMSQIPSIAEHKADNAVKPVIQQVHDLDIRLSDLKTQVERGRQESREDFNRVFQKLDDLSKMVVTIANKDG